MRAAKRVAPGACLEIACGRGTHAVGVVIRRVGNLCVVLLFLRVAQDVDLSTLKAENFDAASLTIVKSIRERWRPIGEIPLFREQQWPLPLFRTMKKGVAVRLAESDLQQVVEQEIPVSEEVWKRLPFNGVSNHQYVEDVCELVRFGALEHDAFAPGAQTEGLESRVFVEFPDRATALAGIAALKKEGYRAKRPVKYEDAYEVAVVLNDAKLAAAEDILQLEEQIESVVRQFRGSISGNEILA
jgi:hypothetical protein